MKPFIVVNLALDRETVEALVAACSGSAVVAYELRQIKALLQRMESYMPKNQELINEIKQKVQEQGTVTQSAITLIRELAQAIKDNADDPEELRAIAADIQARNSELAAGVLEGTGVPVNS